MASLDDYRHRPPREDYRPPNTAQKPESDSAVPPAAPSPPSSTRKSPPASDKNKSSYALQSPELGEIDESEPPAPSPKPKSRVPPVHYKALPQRQAIPQPTDSLSPSVKPTTIQKMIPVTNKSQWEFTEAEVLSSPSVLDGMSPMEERLRRAKGVNFLYTAGGLLELPQMTLWVAGVFFHRFFMRYSLVEAKQGVHHYNIASTALFLANKTEEICRKTKDIIIAVAKTGLKDFRRVIDEQSKEYWRWRDSILLYEELMLDSLTFDLTIENPYDELREVMHRLGMYTNRTIRQPAWAFCNDACLTTLPLLLSAHDIAIAAIFFASIHTGQPLDDVDGQPWWVVVNGTEERCSLAIRVMFQFYTENPLRKSTPNVMSPKFVLSNSRRTGQDMPRVADVVTPVGAHGAGSRAGSLDPGVLTSGGSRVGSAVSVDLGASPTPSLLKRKGSPSEDGDGSQSKRMRVVEE